MLAGGRATRLESLSPTVPKALTPIIGHLLLDILLSQLCEAGYDHVTLCVGHLEEVVRAHVGDGSRAGVAVDYVNDHGRLGTAGPLQLVDAWEEPALVLNADLLTDLAFGEMAARHAASGAAITLAVREYVTHLDVGVVQCDGDGGVVAIVEKPELRQLLTLGIYMIDPEVRSHLRPAQRTDMPELVNRVIESGGHVRTFVHSGRWHDIGTPAGLGAAEDTLGACPAAFGVTERTGP